MCLRKCRKQYKFKAIFFSSTVIARSYINKMSRQTIVNTWSYYINGTRKLQIFSYSTFRYFVKSRKNNQFFSMIFVKRYQYIVYYSLFYFILPRSVYTLETTTNGSKKKKKKIWSTYVPFFVFRIIHFIWYCIKYIKISNALGVVPYGVFEHNIIIICELNQFIY